MGAIKNHLKNNCDAERKEGVRGSSFRKTKTWSAELSAFHRVDTGEAVGVGCGGPGRANDVRGRRRASNPRWQASEGVHRPETPSCLAGYLSIPFSLAQLPASRPRWRRTRAPLRQRTPENINRQRYGTYPLSLIYFYQVHVSVARGDR